MFNLSILEYGATAEQIIDQLAKIQKQLTFMMDGNLNSKNIREVGDFLVGPNYIRSRSGNVGMSSAVIGGAHDDVRFYAGAVDMETAPFRVLNSGKAILSNIEILGGTISWADVTGPTPAQIGALPVDDAKLSQLSSVGAYLGALAEGQVTGLAGKLTNLNSIGDYIGALSQAQIGGLSTRLTNITSTGVYTGTVGTDQLIAGSALIGDALIGNLSANKITTGTLSASRIDTTGLAAEKIYQSGFPNNYMTVGGSFGDLILYDGGSEWFRIYNTFGGVALQYGGTSFMASNGSSTSVGGSWDFSGATVSGLTSTAKFA